MAFQFISMALAISFINGCSLSNEVCCEMPAKMIKIMLLAIHFTPVVATLLNKHLCKFCHVGSKCLEEHWSSYNVTVRISASYVTL